MIGDMDKRHVLDVQQIRDKCENQTYLHISSLKQNHAVKLQSMEINIKKLKEMIDLKDEECRETEKKAFREKDNLYLENERLKNEIKTLIEKKNNELFNAKVQSEK